MTFLFFCLKLSRSEGPPEECIICALEISNLHSFVVCLLARNSYKANLWVIFEPFVVLLQAKSHRIAGAWHALINQRQQFSDALLALPGRGTVEVSPCVFAVKLFILILKISASKTSLPDRHHPTTTPPPPASEGFLSRLSNYDSRIFYKALFFLLFCENYICIALYCRLTIRAFFIWGCLVFMFAVAQPHVILLVHILTS